jgi:TPR repeat protein
LPICERADKCVFLEAYAHSAADSFYCGWREPQLPNLASPHDAEGNYSASNQESEQGNFPAEYLLGTFYYVDQGMPQDSQDALKWFRRAADHGYPGAQFMLSSMYALGQGVQQDLVQAHMWANLAAAQGLQDALEVRDALEKKMTSAQVVQAQKMAREWKQKPER